MLLGKSLWLLKIVAINLLLNAWLAKLHFVPGFEEELYAHYFQWGIADVQDTRRLWVCILPLATIRISSLTVNLRGISFLGRLPSSSIIEAPVSSHEGLRASPASFCAA